MIIGGYHGNDTPADPNMVVSVHLPRKPTSTNNYEGGGGGVKNCHFQLGFTFLENCT